jgi:type IV pilus assembly protein PilW
MTPHLNRPSGFSIIELMIAILLASILLLGITALFNTTSSVNRTEEGLARLQENGRFAMSRIVDDLRMMTAQYCVTRSSGASQQGTWSYADAGRPLVANFNFAAFPQFGLPANPTAAPRYWIGPRHMAFGSECDTAGGCAPALGIVGTGADLFNISGSGPLPAVGTAAGNRARGADVLTIRYLAGQGIRLAGDAVGPPGVAAAIPLESALTFTSSNNIALMTDCSDTDVFRVAAGGAVLTPAGNANDGTVGRYLRREDTRVFDFERDFRAVTYYLRLIADPNPDAPAGRLISALARRQNGVDQVIAEGIERLDFTYVLEDREGRTHYLNAAGVHAWPIANCPPRPPVQLGANMDNNCGWRSIRGIEVTLLANTVADVGGRDAESFVYSFTSAGAANAGATPEVACDPSYGACPGGTVTTLASGLRPGRMLRREFRTLVSIRNNNF